MSCEQCIRESRIDRSFTRPPLQNPNNHITPLEDAMQIDLVPKLPPSGGYENIVAAMYVFSRYLFAYPTLNQDGKTLAKALINIMTKHAYLPTNLLSDKGTAFMSHVIKEVAGVLGITLKHATTKHAQRIGLLERSHASIKQALKIETGERRSLWHKHFNIAVIIYNTSYHTSIACGPGRVFHGHIPYNVLELKLGIRPQQQPIPTWQNAQDVLDQTEMIQQDVRKNAMQAYIKYKAYYDKKPTLQSSMKQIMYMSYSRKQIIKGVKFHLQNSVGLARTLSKRCYQITTSWYAKLAPKRRKCFIGCVCVSSHFTNHQLTYESSHRIINPIPR